MKSWQPGVLALLVCGAGCQHKEVVASFPDRFAGVGFELRLENNAPVVVRTLPGGSAEEAGLLAGDRIIYIDGISTHGQSLGDVVMRVRGEIGTQVNLSIERGKTRMVVVLKRREMVKDSRDYVGKQ